MGEYSEWQVIARKVASGNFGEIQKVWRYAPGTQNPQYGALKTHKARVGSLAQDLIEAEIEAISRLDSPYVPTFYEAGKDSQGGSWFVVQFIEGKTLAEVVKDSGVLTDDEWFQLAFNIASALKVAHAEGIRHCDIKPDNIMRRDNGDWVLIDFGLSRKQFERPQAAWNLTYSAPEQFDSKAEVTVAADVFAFASCLYFALANVNPFDRYRGIDYVKAVREFGPSLTSVDESKRAILAPMLSFLAQTRPVSSDLVTMFRNKTSDAERAEWHPDRLKSWFQLANLIDLSLDRQNSVTLSIRQGGFDLLLKVFESSCGFKLTVQALRNLPFSISASGRQVLIDHQLSVDGSGSIYMRKAVSKSEIATLAVIALREGVRLSLAELNYKVLT